MDFRDF